MKYTNLKNTTANNLQVELFFSRVAVFVGNEQSTIPDQNLRRSAWVERRQVKTKVLCIATVDEAHCRADAQAKQLQRVEKSRSAGYHYQPCS